MYLTTKGLVLRAVRYKESSYVLTLLTAEQGKITATAKGAVRKGSRLAAACQALCYSEFTLFGNRGRWTVHEANLEEQFLGLREDISQLALGAYFAEVLDTVCPEEQPAGPALQVALNALYALSRGIYGPEHVKAVFELRLMSLEGFQPETEVCGVCGRLDMDGPMFSPASGMTHCAGCAPGTAGASVGLDEGALSALRHIISAPAKREFSFALPEVSLERLGRAAELFVRYQLDKNFYSLDYWKSVK